MSESANIALSQFPVVVSLPVQWGDEDSFGHVNNTAHIRWFESSRVAYIENSGLRMILTAGKVIGPILASITCNYRRQLNFPDTVKIGSRVSNLGRSSMTIEHAIYSESQKEIAADGHSVIVMFNFEAQRPIRVSQEIREAVEKLEGKSFS